MSSPLWHDPAVEFLNFVLIFVGGLSGSPAARARAAGVRPPGDQLPAHGHAVPHRRPGLDPPGAELLTPGARRNHGHAQRALHPAHPGGAGPRHRAHRYRRLRPGLRPGRLALRPVLGAAHGHGAHCPDRPLRHPVRPAPALYRPGRAAVVVRPLHGPAPLVASPVERRRPGLQRGDPRRAHLHLVDVHLLGVGRDDGRAPAHAEGRRGHARGAAASAAGAGDAVAVPRGGCGQRGAGLRQHRPAALHGAERPGALLVQPAQLGLVHRRVDAFARLAARPLGDREARRRAGLGRSRLQPARERAGPARRQAARISRFRSTARSPTWRTTRPRTGSS